MAVYTVQKTHATELLGTGHVNAAKALARGERGRTVTGGNAASDIGSTGCARKLAGIELRCSERRESLMSATSSIKLTKDQRLNHSFRVMSQSCALDLGGNRRVYSDTRSCVVGEEAWEWEDMRLCISLHRRRLC